MARLPQPGSDDGKWGAILNDYLSQSHTADGRIKPGAVTKSDVGLENVDNTSDQDKPISTAAQAALDTKLTADALDTQVAGTIKDDVSATKTALSTLFASTNISPLAVREGRPIALGDTTTWSTYVTGTGTVTKATDPVVGDYIRLSTTAQAAYQAGRDMPIKLGSGRAVSFLLRRNSASLSVFDLFAGLGTYGIANYRRWNKGVSGLDVGTWRRVVYVPSEYEGGTTGTVNDPTDLRSLVLRITPTAGNDTSIDIADFRFHDLEDREATVSFLFDDGRSDTYTEAFTRLSAKGYVAGVAVEHDQIGVNVARMTLAQLHELYDAGWDVHGHHTAQMTTISTNDQIAVHRASKAFLATNNFRRGSNIWVWPGGARTAATDAIALNYWQTLRRVSPFTIHGAAHIYEPADPSVFYVTASKPVADLKAAVDRAIMAGSALVFVFHSIKSSGAVAEDYLTADFQNLLDYIETRNVAVVPPSAIWTQ